MPKKSKTKTPKPMEIVFVLDRSGSMNKIKEDTIGGFNAFVAEQRKQPGECHLSLLQFDDLHETAYRGVPISDVDDLTDDTFIPRGSTALRDAIARGAALLKERVKKGGLGALAILTDGLENASQEISKEALRDVLAGCDALGFGVIYLGADQDACAVGADLGIPAARAATYTGDNVSKGFGAAGQNLAAFRDSGDVGALSFSTAQRRGMVSEPSSTGGLIGSTEAAELLGVSPSTLRRREAQGVGPKPMRATETSHRQYRRGSVREWIDGKEG